MLGRYNPMFETIWRVNTAVQLLLALIVTEPSEQSVSPFQPEKTEPAGRCGGKLHNGALRKLSATACAAVNPANAACDCAHAGAGAGYGQVIGDQFK